MNDRDPHPLAKTLLDTKRMQADLEATIARAQEIVKQTKKTIEALEQQIRDESAPPAAQRPADDI